MSKSLRNELAYCLFSFSWVVLHLSQCSVCRWRKSPCKRLRATCATVQWRASSLQAQPSQKRGSRFYRFFQTCTEKCWHALILHAGHPPLCFLVAVPFLPTLARCLHGANNTKIRENEACLGADSTAILELWVQTAHKVRKVEHF